MTVSSPFNVTSSKYSGTATSGTSTVLTDSGASFGTDAVGRVCWIRSGTAVGCRGEITARTATTLTVKLVRYDGGDDELKHETPDNTSVYEVSHNLQDCIDASVTGLAKQGDRQFRATSKLTVSSNAFFHDADCQLEINTGSADSCLSVSTTGCMQLGYLNDDDSVSGGVQIRIYSSKSSSSVILMVGGTGAGGIFYFYGATFHVEAPNAPRGLFWYCNNASPKDWKNCLFIGWKGGARVQGADTRMENLTFIEATTTAGPLNFVGEIGRAKNINVFNSDYAFYWYQGFAGPVIRGLSSTDVGDTILMWGGTSSGNLELIDYSGDTLTFAKQNTPNDTQKIEEIYSYIPLVMDDASVDIEDMRLYIEDTDGTEVINKLSDSDGEYTENLLVRGTYKASDNGVIVAETPHLIRFRHYDYVFKEFMHTADSPFRSNVGFVDSPFVDVAESTAAAYTGITISAGSELITISANHTLQEIYDYIQWWATESGNIDENVPLSTSDGINFVILPDWDLTINTGITVTAANQTLTFSGSGSWTLTGTAVFTGLMTDASKARVPITLSNIVTGSRIYIEKTDHTSIHNAVLTGTTLTVYYEETADTNVNITIAHASGTPTYKRWVLSNVTVTKAAGFSGVVSQQLDE